MSVVSCPATATVDPVTGVITCTINIRPNGQIGQGMYQAIANDLAAGDPVPVFTKTLGVDSNGVRTGDIDLLITMPTI